MPGGGGRGFCRAGFAGAGRMAGCGWRGRMGTAFAQPEAATLKQEAEQLKARLEALEQAIKTAENDGTK